MRSRSTISGGLEPDTDQLDLLRPTVQVRTRSLNFASSFAKHEAIRNLLTLPGRIVTADSTFVMINLDTEITDIGRDDNDRHILTANYRMIRERA